MSISTGPVNTRVVAAAAAVIESTAQSTGGVSIEVAKTRRSTGTEREARGMVVGGRRAARRALESSAGGIKQCHGQSLTHQYLKTLQVA